MMRTEKSKMGHASSRSGHGHASSAAFFARIATFTAAAAGRGSTFVLAASIIVIWAVTGPVFGFSDTWQLVINTGTTIVTFLMVFLIQNSQNRDNAAIQVKLDELIRVSAAKNSFVGIEHLTDEEIEELRTTCEARAAAKIRGKHSVEHAAKAAEEAARRATS
jgi:low affinity Fe/Cu permease